MTLHYIAYIWHYITLVYDITIHYIYNITLHICHNTTLHIWHYITLHIWHYITLHIWHYITLHCIYDITLHYIYDITLHYIYANIFLKLLQAVVLRTLQTYGRSNDRLWAKTSVFRPSTGSVSGTHFVDCTAHPLAFSVVIGLWLRPQCSDWYTSDWSTAA